MRHCVEARLLKAIGQESSERSGWFFQRDRDGEEDRWPESFELIPDEGHPADSVEYDDADHN